MEWADRFNIPDNFPSTGMIRDDAVVACERMLPRRSSGASNKSNNSSFHGESHKSSFNDRRDVAPSEFVVLSPSSAPSGVGYDFCSVNLLCSRSCNISIPIDSASTADISSNNFEVMLSSSSVGAAAAAPSPLCVHSGRV